MPQIFLSHSTKDKKAVRKLAQDLRNAGINVWVDESEIRVGDSIAKEIQKGLRESDYVGIWLTQHAIESGWVEKEWQAKLPDEASQRKTIVLPLLAGDIELPVFLRDRLFADFRVDYQYGLDQLIRTIKTQTPVAQWTIRAYSKGLLEDLSTAQIQFPLHESIDLIETLKRLPRSGKKIRLETYSPVVPVRSVYDHILSVAHSADCLFPLINHGILPHEAIELARCIVYHDLPEVLLGDIPAYTNLTDSKRSRARIFAERRLRKMPPGEPKRIAREFIGMFLDDRERECHATVSHIMADSTSRIHRFFCILDKIDPIVAVWRYLHQFRGRLDAEAHDFLERMRDFFNNPQVKISATEYREDSVIKDLALSLQNRQLARNYYLNEEALSEIESGLDRSDLAQLIQGLRLVFVNTKGDHQRRRSTDKRQ